MELVVDEYSASSLGLSLLAIATLLCGLEVIRLGSIAWD
jgi:hypothetical protein